MEFTPLEYLMLLGLQDGRIYKEPIRQFLIDNDYQDANNAYLLGFYFSSTCPWCDLEII